jgi:hypothetical protein
MFVCGKGSLDVEAYLETTNHTKNVRGESSLYKISNCFVQAGSKEEVTCSRGHISVALRKTTAVTDVDWTSNLMKKVFPNSEIARKQTSSQTKIEAIISGVISSHAVETEGFHGDAPFWGMATYASNHLALKYFPLLIQYLFRKRLGCKQNYWMFRTHPMKLHKLLNSIFTGH